MFLGGWARLAAYGPAQLANCRDGPTAVLVEDGIGLRGPSVGDHEVVPNRVQYAVADVPDLTWHGLAKPVGQSNYAPR